MLSEEHYLRSLVRDFIRNKIVSLKVTLLAFRLLNNRIPTKDNLVRHDFGNLNSLMCNSDWEKDESTQHLFFDCPILGD